MFSNTDVRMKNTRSQLCQNFITYYSSTVPSNAVNDFSILCFRGYDEKVQDYQKEYGYVADGVDANQNPLVGACLGHNSNIIQSQLQHQYNVNSYDSYGNTPLSAALQHNNIPLVTQLLSAKANPNSLCAGNLPVQLYACIANNSKCLQLLLEHKVEQTHTVKETGEDGTVMIHNAIDYAASSGCNDIIELLLLNGGDCKEYVSPQSMQTSALGTALQRGHIHTLDIFIKYHSRYAISRVFANKEARLCVYAHIHNTKYLHLLNQHGIYLGQYNDKELFDILTTAILKKIHKTIDIVLDSQVYVFHRVTCRTMKSHSVNQSLCVCSDLFSLACFYGDISILARMLEDCTRMGPVLAGCETPLTAAMKGQQPDVVLFLIEKQPLSCLTLKNGLGETPAGLAAQQPRGDKTRFIVGTAQRVFSASRSVTSHPTTHAFFRALPCRYLFKTQFHWSMKYKAKPVVVTPAVDTPDIQYFPPSQIYQLAASTKPAAVRQLRLLLEYRAVYTRCKNTVSPLQIACATGATDNVRLLLERKVPSPALALQGTDTECAVIRIPYFVDKRVLFPSMRLDTLTYQINNCESSCIELAAQNNHYLTLQYLLQEYLGPQDIKSDLIQNALQNTVLKIVQLPRLHADDTNLWMIFLFLLSYCEELPSNVDFTNIFCLSIAKGNVSAVMRLYTACQNMNVLDQCGETPLTTAVLYKQPTIIKLQLSWGADQNMPNNRGITAMMYTEVIPAVQMRNKIESLLLAESVLPVELGGDNSDEDDHLHDQHLKGEQAVVMAHEVMQSNLQHVCAVSLEEVARQLLFLASHSADTCASSTNVYERAKKFLMNYFDHQKDNKDILKSLLSRLVKVKARLTGEDLNIQTVEILQAQLTVAQQYIQSQSVFLLQAKVGLDNPPSMSTVSQKNTMSSEEQLHSYGLLKQAMYIYTAVFKQFDPFHSNSMTNSEETATSNNLSEEMLFIDNCIKQYNAQAGDSVAYSCSNASRIVERLIFDNTSPKDGLLDLYAMQQPHLFVDFIHTLGRNVEYALQQTTPAESPRLIFDLTTDQLQFCQDIYVPSSFSPSYTAYFDTLVALPLLLDPKILAAVTVAASIAVLAVLLHKQFDQPLVATYRSFIRYSGYQHLFSSRIYISLYRVFSGSNANLFALNQTKLEDTKNYPITAHIDEEQMVYLLHTLFEPLVTLFTAIEPVKKV